jgi:hypothetical protein
MSLGATSSTAGFPAEFEAALARLRYALAEAYAVRDKEPQRVAAAILAGFTFASHNPKTVLVLTSRALSQGGYGVARYRDLLLRAARVLARCRAERPENTDLPAITERALIGGLVTLVAQRLDTGRAGELPALAPQAVEFVLSPYLGANEARRLANAPNLP